MDTKPNIMSISEEQYAEISKRMQANGRIISTTTEVFPVPFKVLPDEVQQDLRPEWMIEAECTKLLEEDGWRSLRTDPVSDRSKGKGFGELGMADHLYFRYLDEAQIEFPSSDGRLRIAVLKSPAAEVLWIEFKSANGKPAKKQLEWHQKERARGALTLIAGVDFPASVDGFKRWYASSGLKRC